MSSTALRAERHDFGSALYAEQAGPYVFALPPGLSSQVLVSGSTLRSPPPDVTATPDLAHLADGEWLGEPGSPADDQHPLTVGPRRAKTSLVIEAGPPLGAASADSGCFVSGCGGKSRVAQPAEVRASPARSGAARRSWRVPYVDYFLAAVRDGARTGRVSGPEAGATDAGASLLSVARGRPARMSTQPKHEVVPASALLRGDQVTETDTPAGPWYVIDGVDLGRGVLTVDDGQGLLVQVPMPSGAGLVLRRV